MSSQAETRQVLKEIKEILIEALEIINGKEQSVNDPSK
jgi:hypothetical protein